MIILFMCIHIPNAERLMRVNWSNYVKNHYLHTCQTANY